MEKILEDIIHGKLNSKNKSSKLIIFVHGLGGNINEHIFYDGYKFFNKEGFDVFRLDLYAEINLTNNSIQQHSKDLEETINYFKSQYNELYLIGHSLGGPIILQSNTEAVRKIILWDPVLNCESLLTKELMYKDGICHVSWGMDILIGKKMEEEINNTGDLSSNLNEKYGIIYAENSPWKSQFKTPQIDSMIIQGADHCFNNEGNEIILFENTLKFMNK